MMWVRWALVLSVILWTSSVATTIYEHEGLLALLALVGVMLLAIAGVLETYRKGPGAS
jgi:hypothetical protein